MHERLNFEILPSHKWVKFKISSCTVALNSAPLGAKFYLFQILRAVNFAAS
ncbi:hypothetical protein CAMGR0001_0774 [Campylobacter gracilis RM3268]|uniref:Uncharacterized protein n=1 Tax=Campylobacter gracilis RM3268 TaxID=553220 RepID=C8PFY1_9BACT|nr:hypothetical protein CAMGR0001_0774 [Campylobacter gracilis RM3268]